MRVECGPYTYEWMEHWVRIPDTESAKTSKTHGVAVVSGGDVLVFNQGQPALLRYSAEGILKNAWGDRFAGAHGLTVVCEDGVERLWLVDQVTCEVVKTSLDGKTLLNLERPPIPLYQGTRYIPTWVAVHEERWRGNGDVWVADGYGGNYVHRYSRSGAYLSSINGTEGKAGAFDCPHGISFISSDDGVELYIADRGNARVQVYDAEGKFKRVVGAGFLSSPCGFASREGVIYVPELFGRLTLMDQRGRLIGYIGENPGIDRTVGWPHLSPDQIHVGKFNSPHGVAVDEQGNAYIGEWIYGGRVVKLARL